MSIFDRQGPPLAGPIEDPGGDGQGSPDSLGGGQASSPAEQLPVDGVQEVDAAAGSSLQFDPHRDARALVRLVQCQRCSLPLHQPMTLACGNSLCRRCLPDLHKRENISYPAWDGRSEGLMCPFEDCRREHSMGDCSNDISLSKVLEQVSAEIARYRPLNIDTPTLLDERPHWRNVVDSCANPTNARSCILHGGRLVATFTMAELGQLEYDAEVSYQTCSPTGDSYAHLDYGMLEHLREVTRDELDCHVCYALIYDPLTLSCGHTFCRRCVSQILNHSQTCPTCRRPLLLTPAAVTSSQSNKRLSQLLQALCPDQLATRAQLIQADEAASGPPQHQQVPLFICTLAYPRIPTFLHIFEPRYCLMIQRAMAADRKFGMLAYNAQGEDQGDLGATQFMQYGTLLEIINMHMYPNGCSIIETVGVSRFRVREHGMRDDYTVGRVERIDDIAVAEEEELESQQVSAAGPTSNPSPENPPLEGISTVRLMEICTDFIRRMRNASAHWLSGRMIQAYGPMPDDPASFPYWFASVLPINETEKYRLLPTRSVRVRLLICAEWVRRVERTRWYARLREFMNSGSPEGHASLHESDAAATVGPHISDDGHEDEDEGGDGEEDRNGARSEMLLSPRTETTAPQPTSAYPHVEEASSNPDEISGAESISLDLSSDAHTRLSETAPAPETAPSSESSTSQSPEASQPSVGDSWIDASPSVGDSWVDVSQSPPRASSPTSQPPDPSPAADQ